MKTDYRVIDYSGHAPFYTVTDHLDLTVYIYSEAQYDAALDCAIDIEKHTKVGTNVVPIG